MQKHMRELQKELLATPDHTEELAKIKQIFNELKPKLERGGEDRPGIAKAEVQDAAGEEKPEPPAFTPYKLPCRRPGRSYVSRLGDHLWEGRRSPVWPNGKKRARNVYVKTETECEEKSKRLN